MASWLVSTWKGLVFVANFVMSIEFLDTESNDLLDTESMEFLDIF